MPGRDSVKRRWRGARTPRPGRAAAVAFTAAAAAIWGACGGGSGGASERGAEILDAVATTGMVADAVRQIGGERVSVTGLMGPGVDPHLYRASAGDVRSLVSADIIFYNGLHLEAAMGEVLEEMSGRSLTVPIADGIAPERRISSEYFVGSWDPHVWFDVELWASTTVAVEQALVRLDPDGEAGYRGRAVAYRDTLAKLEGWVRARVAELPEERRILVTAHDAFGYFGRAYGFEVVGLQGISTVTEAGTADVQRIAELVVDRKIPAIFVETSVSQRTIEAVQAAVRDRGEEVRIGGSLFSDAMGSAGTPEGTYPGMVRHNVNTIVDALLTGVDAE
jgi:manganese/zinc/iron transport system substrate-binding protein